VQLALIKLEVGLNIALRTALGRFGRVLAALTVLVAIFGGPILSQASAASTDGSALLIKGTVKNEKKPVEGVEFRITGNGIEEIAISNAEGKWQLEVEKKGIYQVEILLESLPQGVGLRDPEASTREADLTFTNTAAVLFPLGIDTRVIQPIGDQIIIRLFAGLNLGLLLAVAAIGISLIFGTTGLNNFAHGEMVTFGALFTWLFHVELKMPLLLAAAITIALSAGFGWLQDSALWKPLRKRRLGLNQIMIVSIGLSIILRQLYILFFEGDTKVLSSEYEKVVLGPINTTSSSIWSMALSVVALAFVAWFLTRTRIGKAARAVSDNASLAAATGINVERIIRIVWVMAGALTGLAGILYGLQFQANYLLGAQILLLLFASVTLGGLGKALGATVGAIIIGFVVELSALIIPIDLKYAAALIILIVVLLVRPQGVLGKKQRIG
jgi:branched-chain amino acid transport system permease protein